MQATINGLSTLLAEITAIASQNSYQDAVDAIVAEINSGSTVDFENSTHLELILKEQACLAQNMNRLLQVYQMQLQKLISNYMKCLQKMVVNFLMMMQEVLPY